ncbi:hypothetical protein [Pseudotamlana agarivorans]|uniref:hypothetical protein n=1 Tax=Pseudotamlana agarivorans TaxID=481183 RepID=UPI00082A3E88|nr:hypothetical protein [Tamlana agarivorans]
MKKIIVLSIFIISVFYSCKSDPKITDYSEDDLYEVQGILDFIGSNSNPFDHHTIKDVRFSYFLDRSIPKKGSENNLDLRDVEYAFRPNDIQNGYPLIVLVHKDDENISFYGQVGVLDNLNEKEKAFLTGYIQSKMDKIKKETPEYIYNALIEEKQTGKD